jgi:hypothetical protein
MRLGSCAPDFLKQRAGASAGLSDDREALRLGARTDV